MSNQPKAMIDPYVYDELARLPMCGICCKRAASAEMEIWRHFADCPWIAKHLASRRRFNVWSWIVRLNRSD